MNKKLLVTLGLPYANGPLHLGHLVGAVQADVWARFQKMCGNDCLYISGSDCHGTPIMLKAEKAGMSAEDWMRKNRAEHIRDLNAFEIDFDNFYLTHSDENRKLTELIFERLKKADAIEKRSVEQAYDPVKEMFLADRYIKGECPFCGAKDQYGDGCEVCGATYSSLDLKNPVSAVSGEKPVIKKSDHYFFKLGNYEAFLKKWTHEGHIDEAVMHKMDEWFEQGLKEWDISRDGPYFGFEIPGEKDKYFYVWLDAPIGYMSSLKNLCDKRDDLNFDDYWKPESDAALYHFIGKDIAYFHTLFWPAVLKSANFRTPTAVFIHGLLTIDGQKMSKSRGTFINARDYLDYFHPEYLRYYFTAKLNPHIDDMDLNLEDFQAKVNSDLVGKVVNIASRCAGFIEKHFGGELSETLHDEKLFKQVSDANEIIKKHYETRYFANAMRDIMQLADLVNQYIDAKKPWKLIKEADKKESVQTICTMGLNLFRLLLIYLKPVLPEMTKKAENFLAVSPLTWNDVHQPLLARKIKPFEPLMQRIDTKVMDEFKKSL